MKHWLMAVFLLAVCTSLFSCSNGDAVDSEDATAEESEMPLPDTMVRKNEPVSQPDTIIINVKDRSPEVVVSFAKTLIGIPYKYASADPKEGFDCSGFITYVFNHFNIKVPRSSADFTNVGKAVDQGQAKTGDLILFTGTDTAETRVGHMGIVTENTDSIRFIHSTSGKKYGVTITALNEYYQRRFVKVIRVF